MSDRISDEIFDQIMSAYWEQITRYAYDGYREHGRGAVGIEKIAAGGGSEHPEFTLCYVSA
jgi:hypothetical protein